MQSRELTDRQARNYGLPRREPVPPYAPITWFEGTDEQCEPDDCDGVEQVEGM